MTRIITTIALAILATTAHARDLQPSHFRAVHLEMARRSMDPNGNCWESATAVWRRAREYGYQAKILTWDTPGRWGHAIPVVEVNGEWHHITDRWVSGDPWTGSSGFLRSWSSRRAEVNTDPDFLGILTGRRVIPGTVEVLDSPPKRYLADAREPVWR